MRKRLLLIGLLVVGVALLSGCELLDELIDQIAGGGTTGVVVDFPDPELEAAIRVAISKPTGDIHEIDLIGLAFLDAAGIDIVNLGGIQYCTNLTELDLRYNQIVNVSPLAGLTNLTELYLDSNLIVDISPLAGLTNLTELWLGSNQIVDIGWLSDLINLTFLDLDKNQIVDIDPLVRNAGIGNGDFVFLTYNNLCLYPGSPDQLDIEELLSRGVTVGSQYQTCL